MNFYKYKKNNIIRFLIYFIKFLIYFDKVSYIFYRTIILSFLYFKKYDIFLKQIISRKIKYIKYINKLYKIVTLKKIK